MSLVKKISNRLRAGALVLVVQESDEQLALEAALKAADGYQPVRAMSASDQQTAMVLMSHKEGEGTLILSDYLAIFGENPMSARLIREIALQQREDAQSRLILLELPETTVPPLIRGDAEIVTASLPGVDELREELEGFIENTGIEADGNGETLYSIASAVAGLARHEALRLFARCWIEQKELDPTWLRKAKAQRIADKLGGALTFESEMSADVGGMEELKSWLSARRAAFSSEKAREFGLPEPKGVLLLGIPGAGKSLTARTVARQWGLPLLRFDVGKAFGSLVGQSEAQTRQATDAAEACAPCVLWIDEIEKGLGGSGGSTSSDGGTTQRVFGTLLTWLQEKTKPVFVVATANKISALPPELLRKGRFDEIFFVDLPDQGERAEIVLIHLNRRNRKLEGGEVKGIAKQTDGFSGAEIEQAIIEGLFTAYARDGDLTGQDVVEAVRRTTPLSKTMANEIGELRSWAKGRARLASAPTKTKKARRGPVLSK